MAKISKRRVQAVAIFIIFLALAAAALTTMKKRDAEPKFDYKDSNNQFIKAGSLNKAEIIVNSLNFGKALDEMNKLVESYSMKTLRKDRKGNNGKYIFIVELTKFPEILAKLAAIGTIEQQSELVDSTLISKKLSTEEAVLASKKNELKRLETQSSVYGSDLGDKNTRIAEIRNLENTIDLLKNGDKTLLYVKLQPSLGGNSLSQLKTFALNFVTYLIGLFMVVVLAYYGTKLIMYLLSLMGVKGFNLSNLGGNYQYGNYGNYANRYYSSRYGYKNSKRKVKRIYKDKPTPHPEDDDSGQKPDKE